VRAQKRTQKEKKVGLKNTLPQSLMMDEQFTENVENNAL